MLGFLRVEAWSRPDVGLVLRGLKREAEQKGAWFSQSYSVEQARSRAGSQRVKA